MSSVPSVVMTFSEPSETPKLVWLMHFWRYVPNVTRSSFQACLSDRIVLPSPSAFRISSMASKLSDSRVGPSSRRKYS